MKGRRLVKGIRSLKSLPAPPGDRDSSVLGKVTFHNLRAFGAVADVPIAPVNLIFGNNNAGKSSVFHSFLWILEVLEKGNLNVHRPGPSGNYIDLGGLKNFIHKTQSGEIADKFGFSLTIEIDKKAKQKICEDVSSSLLSNISETIRTLLLPNRFSGSFSAKKIRNIINSIRQIPKDDMKRSIELLVDSFFDQNCAIQCKVIFDSKPLLKTKGIFDPIFQDPKVDLSFNNKILLKSIPGASKIKKNIVFQGSFFNGECTHPLVGLNEATKKISRHIKIFTNNKQLKRSNKERISLKDIRKLSTFLSERASFSPLIRAQTFQENKGLKIFPRFGRDRMRFGGFLTGKLIEKKMQGKLHYGEEHFKRDVRHDALSLIIGHLCERLQSATQEFFGKINYLAGYRIYLEREISQQTLRDIHQNDPYGTLEIKKLLDSDEKRRRVNSILSKFGAPFSVSTKGKTVKKLFLINKKIKGEWSFKDFGFGWSQVFPFILKLLDKNFSALFIEQPELHLSSYYQQRLMDLIIENVFLNAKDKNNSKTALFLECHSDIMIYRLLKRLRENKKTKNAHYLNNDFSILSVIECDSCSSIKPIKITPDGYLGDKFKNSTLDLAALDLIE